MIELEPIEKIIFLEYLTSYNIQDVYALWQLESVEQMIANFKHSQSMKFNEVSDKHIKDCLNETKITMAKLHYHNVIAIPFYSNDYPENLRAIRNAPPILFVKGVLRNGKNVAIVGSREISTHAAMNVRSITELFATANFGIVSGLAFGIDSLAHNAAINLNAYTIAVMAHSLDSIYPKENYGLASKILDSGGALVSELPFGLNRGKKSFVERNRIQSGLSDIVIPVEMGQNSGTMYTVEFCLTQGKQLLIPIYRPDVMVKKEFEGIRYLIDKYRNKPNSNIKFFNTIESLSIIINNGNSQTTLFPN